MAALEPEQLVPGRGAALTTREQVRDALENTRAFLDDVYDGVRDRVKQGDDMQTAYRRVYEWLRPKYGDWVIFDHCMPFNVSRAFDEATQYADPRVLDGGAR